MYDKNTLFHTTFIDNAADKTLVLLHGTGGSERDFLFLDTPLQRSYNLLGIRGNVIEVGMNRFFKRKAFGVFDQQNIREEAEKLHTFLTNSQRSSDTLVFLGYSNGANMILALLFLYPHLVKKAVLLHPMLPFEPEKLDLSHHEIFLSYGLQDQMISFVESQKVVEVLTKAKAKLITKEYAGGHEITPQELSDVVQFLRGE